MQRDYLTLQDSRIVIVTRAEIIEAIDDFNSGKTGSISTLRSGDSPRTGQSPYVLRVTCYVLRVTCYVLRVTCYVGTYPPVMAYYR